jgi:hypothetical protein
MKSVGTKFKTFKLYVLNCLNVWNGLSPVGI